ncbi:MAG: hypothetical protein KC431_09055, partial [Myxococcales bacterium]|nr:hypothetical protein [Myxococcales bacterium]
MVPRATARQPAAAIVTVAGLLGLSCAELGEQRRFEDEVGPLEIVQTIPAAGEVAFDPLGRIDICFSAEVDPRVIGEFDATLHSGGLTFDAQREVQLYSWRAPGSRDQLAATRWCPGSVISLTPSSPI